MTTLPKINRRGWTALWLHKRRHGGYLRPAPVLVAQYPTQTVWEWNYPNPVHWNAYFTLDGGVTWHFDDYKNGDARSYEPDGGSVFMLIVGVDAYGVEITHRSNAVRPDDALPPPDLSPGLVAHFGLDELSGNRMDDGIDGYVLESINGATATAPGIIGNALAFNGSGNYLGSIDETDMFGPTTDGFAVSVWANFDNVVDPGENAYPVSVWDDTEWPAGSAWQIYVTPAIGGVSAQVLGDVVGFSDLSGSGTVSGWVHICLVFDPVAVLWSLYFNGAVVATAECDDVVVGGFLGVGLHTNPSTPPPDCMIDEIAIWGRKLSATEVGRLYNNGSGLPYASY